MRRGQRVLISAALGVLLAGAARAADPEIDTLLQGPVGKDWVTNGGNLTNQRYSTLKQIDTSNVKQLKGAWMTRLKGSGYGGKYSFEATPLVKDGIMYIVTGNDDVFALNAKTGEFLWERWSGIDQKLTSVCCGWDNRGVAMGEGMVFLGQLDANVVALDIKTGKEVWKTPIEVWQDGYGITSAPLYYDGIVYSGITGGEYGVRGRLTALDAKTGKILWRWYTAACAGTMSAATAGRPAPTLICMAARRSGTRRPLDPQLGLIYFATGNCGPDYDGSIREGDNLFCASVVALNAKTGEYAWHFQEVHHDIWDYDAASPAVLFDTVINGQPRKGIAQAGRTGWVYILDRTNGKPLVGIEEKAGAAGAAAEDRENTALSDRRRDRTAMRPTAGGIRKVRLHLRSLLGRADTGPAIGHRRHELVAHVVQSGYRVVLCSRHRPHQRLCALRGQVQERHCNTTAARRRRRSARPMSGTWTAIAGTTNKIAWQKNVPFRVGSWRRIDHDSRRPRVPRGSWRGNPGARCKDRRTALGSSRPVLARRQRRWSTRSMGMQYIAIAAGGNQGVGSANGDAVWTFSLKGQLNPLWPPPPPPTVAGPASGPIADNADTVKIGDNNVEFGYFPKRDRIKAGTSVTFTNAGDTPHTATSFDNGKIGTWDTGPLNSGQSKTITFDKPGNYYYICTAAPVDVRPGYRRVTRKSGAEFWRSGPRPRFRVRAGLHSNPRADLPPFRPWRVRRIRKRDLDISSPWGWDDVIVVAGRKQQRHVIQPTAAHS